MFSDGERLSDILIILVGVAIVAYGIYLASIIGHSLGLW